MLELRGMALMARTLSDTAKRCQARGREGPGWCDASFARFQFRPVPAHEWSAEAITLKANWINMYDKHGCVLGVETVINDPYAFKVRRRAGRRGRRTLGWHHLPKGVPSCRATPPCRPRPTIATSMPWPSSTTRPRSPCPRPPRAASARLPRPIVACLQPRDHPRPHPLFAAVLRGEHTLYGFRNRDVRTRLFGPPAAA